MQAILQMKNVYIKVYHLQFVMMCSNDSNGFFHSFASEMQNFIQESVNEIVSNLMKEMSSHKIKRQDGKEKKKCKKRNVPIKYRNYSVEFKQNLVNEIKEEERISPFTLAKIIRLKSKQLNIHQKNIYRWYSSDQIKKKEGGRKAAFPAMEEKLVEFVNTQNNPSKQKIIAKAKQIMEELNQPMKNQFNFSKGWFERFKKRNFGRKERLLGENQEQRYFKEIRLSEIWNE